MMTIVYKKVPGINVVAYNNYISANIKKRGGFLLLLSTISVAMHHKVQMIAIVCHQELSIFAQGRFSLLTEHNRTKSRQAYTTL